MNVVLDDPIFNGVVVSLIFCASMLPTLVELPVLCQALVRRTQGVVYG